MQNQEGGTMREYHAYIRWSSSNQIGSEGSGPTPSEISYPQSDASWTLTLEETAGPASLTRSGADRARIPIQWAMPDYVSPGEALVAAVASGHMGEFAGIAAQAGFRVGLYEVDAVGQAMVDEEGCLSIGWVTICPRVRWFGKLRPSRAEIDRFHRQARESSPIARSVRVGIVITLPERGCDAFEPFLRPAH